MSRPDPPNARGDVAQLADTEPSPRSGPHSHSWSRAPSAAGPPDAGPPQHSSNAPRRRRRSRW
jgi:hypothetical protein